MKKAVITRLMGGLGNQMFQYAAGKALAQKNNVPLLFDRSFLDQRGKNIKYTIRDFELDVYNLQTQFATSGEIEKAMRIENSLLLRKFSDKFSRLVTNPVVRENPTGFMEDFHLLKPPLMLIGFWQDERYFLNIRSLLQKEFSPRIPLAGINRDLAGRMEAGESVSIHVRRTDYVNNAVANKFHGTLSPEYYLEAAHKIGEGLVSPEFFIFSDDPEWARKNINLPYSCSWISHNKGKDSYFDLLLMQCCRHHIIANSSFSWWSAWLYDSPESKVIAPKFWFSSAEVNDKDIIPSRWIRI